MEFTKEPYSFHVFLMNSEYAIDALMLVIMLLI